MYVRLAFAVAAHLRSEILLVDEVLAVGDAEFQKKCLGKMEEVARGGRTVLFVSHSMAAVRQLCTTAVCLSNGSIRAAGDVETCVREYVGDRMIRGDIRSSIRSCDPALHIQYVRINDSEASDVTLRSDQNC